MCGVEMSFSSCRLVSFFVKVGLGCKQLDVVLVGCEGGAGVGFGEVVVVYGGVDVVWC